MPPWSSLHHTLSAWPACITFITYLPSSPFLLPCTCNLVYIISVQLFLFLFFLCILPLNLFMFVQHTGGDPVTQIQGPLSHFPLHVATCWLTKDPTSQKLIPRYMIGRLRFKWSSWVTNNIVENVIWVSNAVCEIYIACFKMFFGTQILPLSFISYFLKCVLRLKSILWVSSPSF